MDPKTKEEAMEWAVKIEEKPATANGFKLYYNPEHNIEPQNSFQNPNQTYTY